MSQLDNLLMLATPYCKPTAKPDHEVGTECHLPNSNTVLQRLYASLSAETEFHFGRKGEAFPPKRNCVSAEMRR